MIRKQSELTPAELLRPFGEVGNLGNIALQTCEKNQPFRLKNFRVDFVDSNKIDTMNPNDQSMYIDVIIQNSAPKKFFDSSASSLLGNQGSSIQQNQQKELEQWQNQLISLVEKGEEFVTPWFTSWKR